MALFMSLKITLNLSNLILPNNQEQKDKRRPSGNKIVPNTKPSSNRLDGTNNHTNDDLKPELGVRTPRQMKV